MPPQKTNLFSSGFQGHVTGFYLMATAGVLAPGSSYTLRITTLPSAFKTVTPPPRLRRRSPGKASP
jgi:hypothetical protein